MKQYLGVLIFCILFITNKTYAQIEITEVAWMGTTQSANDEWIELFNTSSDPISLDGWTLTTADQTPTIPLSGTVSSGEYFLLERTNDETVPNISADLIYVGALGNGGETLALFNRDNNEVFRINAGDAWPAGDNTTKETMQKRGDVWITAVGTPKAATFIQSLPVTPQEELPPPPPIPPLAQETVATPPPEVIQAPVQDVAPEIPPVPYVSIQVPAIPTEVQPEPVPAPSMKSEEVKPPQKIVEVPKPIQKKKKTTSQKARAILENTSIDLAAQAYTVEKPQTIWEKLLLFPQNIINFIKNLFH